MIAIKNLQNLNEILTQEEVLQVVANHYTELLTDKKAVTLFKDIIKTSEKNHQEIMKYLESHIGIELPTMQGGN